jgi:hypothetical protein
MGKFHARPPSVEGMRPRQRRAPAIEVEFGPASPPSDNETSMSIAKSYSRSSQAFPIHAHIVLLHLLHACSWDFLSRKKALVKVWNVLALIENSASNTIFGLSRERFCPLAVAGIVTLGVGVVAPVQQVGMRGEMIISRACLK